MSFAKHTSPLAFYYLAKGRGAFYSSDSKHLALAMKRAGIAGTLALAGNDQLYTLDFTSGALEVSKSPLEVPKLVYPSYYNDWSGYKAKAKDKSSKKFDSWVESIYGDSDY
jgi:hypothetical protein